MEPAHILWVVEVHRCSSSAVNGHHSVLTSRGLPPDPVLAAAATVWPMGVGEGVGTDAELNLKQVAARLGVHYMTAYRYVRTGRLPATKVGAGWVVSGADLDAFAVLGPEVELPGGTDWRGRMRDRLLDGDETGAWRVIEQALVSGRSATDCYLDLVGGALADIDAGAADPGSGIDAAAPFLATATASRLVARLGGRFRRPGRSRGTVVFGAPEGERHDLPIAIVADLVRMEGFACLELGADVAPGAFAAAVDRAERLVAVGIGVTRVENLDAVESTIVAVRAVDPSVAVVVGGQGVRNAEVAALIGATGWAPDGPGAVALIEELSHRR